jgi:hypothetical protein
MYSKWNFGRFKEGIETFKLIADLKEIFNPRWKFWRIVNQAGQTVPVKLTAGNFRFIEAGPAEPVKLRRKKADEVLPHQEEDQNATTDDEWNRLNEAFAGLKNPLLEESAPPPTMLAPPTSPKSNHEDLPPSKPNGNNSPRRDLDGPSCTLSWQGKRMTLYLQSKIQRRPQLFLKWFGSSEFYCYDPVEKKQVSVKQCIENVEYILRKKTPSKPPTSRSEDFQVTFLTELGKKEKVRLRTSDSEERQSGTLRNQSIVGARRFLIEGREITWQDFRPGDIISVERITDSSIWVKVGNNDDAKEFKDLSSDPVSGGKMAQNYWPNQQLFRRFDRAPPASWTPDETLWILPANQWHLCVKFGGVMRQIAFNTEEQFFRQAENWANGLVNIVDENGHEVLLQDTVDTECYYLAKSPYVRNITFRWDGLIMEARFDGTNARFWRNVRKLVDARELCLLDNGRFVSPDRAVSKNIYQLVRTEAGKIIQGVKIKRGEEEISCDAQYSDISKEIRLKWGEGDWKLVDRAGVPYAFKDLRDGSMYFAVKKNEP